jgi:hypothetical protein
MRNEWNLPQNGFQRVQMHKRGPDFAKGKGPGLKDPGPERPRDYKSQRKIIQVIHKI